MNQTLQRQNRLKAEPLRQKKTSGRRVRRRQTRKLLSVELDLPIQPKLIIKQRFDWDLSKQHISPSEFIKRVCAELGFCRQTEERLRNQLMSQIIEEMRRPPELQDISSSSESEEEVQKNEENEKKKLSRMRRLELQKKQAQETQGRGLKDERNCPNCGVEAQGSLFECKRCKLPQNVVQDLDFNSLRVRICAKFYERVASKIPLLVYEARNRCFFWEDFHSLTRLLYKIRFVLTNSKDITSQSLCKIIYIMERYYQETLKGHVQANHPTWTDYSANAQSENLPKRKRGRPKKVRVLGDELDKSSLEEEESISEVDFAGEEELQQEAHEPAQ